MNHAFPRLHRHFSLGVFSVALIIGMALIVKTSGELETNEYFSADVLGQFELLNQQHGMVMQSLVGDPISPVMWELFQSNVLGAQSMEASGNQGLIVSFEDQEEMLLFEPVYELSEEELEQVAKDYMERIPSALLEVDQELKLFGEQNYESLPFYKGDSVELTEESSIEMQVLVPELEIVRPVHIAVIDSGVDMTHEIFSENQFAPGWNTISGNNSSWDDVGHGTHIASIITSQVPGVVIVPYKIVDKNGGRLSNVLEAMDHAIDDEVDVINTSFGLLSASPALKLLLDEAQEEGIVVVSAAGNRGTDQAFYPASYDSTVAVASVDTYGNKLPKSNYGYWVDVAALGFNVRAALPNNGYGLKSGTSQGCAFVSAEVARIMNEAGLQNELSFDDILAGLTTDRLQIAEGVLAGTPIIQ
jgi:hypothetical protein